MTRLLSTVHIHRQALAEEHRLQHASVMRHNQMMLAHLREAQLALLSEKLRASSAAADHRPSHHEQHEAQARVVQTPPHGSEFLPPVNSAGG